MSRPAGPREFLCSKCRETKAASHFVCEITQRKRVDGRVVDVCVSRFRSLCSECRHKAAAHMREVRDDPQRTPKVEQRTLCDCGREVLAKNLPQHRSSKLHMQLMSARQRPTSVPQVGRLSFDKAPKDSLRMPEKTPDPPVVRRTPMMMELNPQASPLVEVPQRMRDFVSQRQSSAHSSIQSISRALGDTSRPR